MNCNLKPHLQASESLFDTPAPADMHGEDHSRSDGEAYYSFLNARRGDIRHQAMWKCTKIRNHTKRLVES